VQASVGRDKAGIASSIFGCAGFWVSFVPELAKDNARVQAMYHCKPLPRNVFRLSAPIVSRAGDVQAAGNEPASPVDASHTGGTTYDMMNGGGGNCTRVPSAASPILSDTYEKCPLGLPELSRDDAAVRALVMNWHLLTPDVRAAIFQLVSRSH